MNRFQGGPAARFTRPLALALALSMSAPAAMAARGDDAVTLHKQAIGHAREKRYAEAAQAFAAEYAMTKKPDLLFNIAECQRLLYADTKKGEALAEARRAYQRYIDAAPDGKVVDKAREWLHTLDEEARKQPAAPPPVAPAPAPAPSTKPDLEVRHAPPQAATTPATAAAEEDTPVYKKWWLWTAVGVVAAGAITGIVLATRPKNVEVPGVHDFDPQAFR